MQRMTASVASGEASSDMDTDFRMSFVCMHDRVLSAHLSRSIIKRGQALQGELVCVLGSSFPPLLHAEAQVVSITQLSHRDTVLQLHEVSCANTCLNCV